MGCFKQCRRWTVLIFNCLFLIVGISLIVLGTQTYSNFTEFSKIVPHSYTYIKATPILLIVLGSIIVPVALLGTLGILHWNLCLLNTYTVALLIIFLLHIILSLAAFLAVTDQNDLAQNVNSTIDEIFKNYSENGASIDFMQNRFECCGTSGPSFWKSVNLKIPSSCCEDCKDLFRKGCQVAFYNFLIMSIRLVGTTILVLSPLQVIGATFSLSLVNSIRNYERRYGKYIR